MLPFIVPSPKHVSLLQDCCPLVRFGAAWVSEKSMLISSLMWREWKASSSWWRRGLETQVEGLAACGENTAIHV